MAKKDEKDEVPGSRDITTSDVTGEELGTKEAQELMDEETEKGYRGERPYDIDKHAYTVEGVTNNEPTPETHPSAAMKVGSNRFIHVPQEDASDKSSKKKGRK